MKYLLAIVFFLPLYVFAHGGHQAFYVIEKGKSAWTLTVKMETADIETELESKGLKADYMPLGIEQYLKENLVISINEAVVNRTFNSSYSSRGYTFCSFDMTEVPEELKKIQITNTCFKDYDHSYDNLISIIVDGEEVSFKMDANRTEIIHDFK